MSDMENLKIDENEVFSEIVFFVQDYGAELCEDLESARTSLSKMETLVGTLRAIHGQIKRLMTPDEFANQYGSRCDIARGYIRDINMKISELVRLERVNAAEKEKLDREASRVLAIELERLRLDRLSEREAQERASNATKQEGIVLIARETLRDS